jgi:thiol-disulfide isomerase/thioredoxin
VVSIFNSIVGIFASLRASRASAQHPLPTACCLLPTNSRLLPTNSCLLPAISCLLPTVLLIAGCSRHNPSTDAAARTEASMQAQAVGAGGGPPSKMLEYQVGDPLPELSGAGWLNGPAPTAADLEGNVVVVDIWNDLCGMCREVAPDLSRLQEKYHDRGVVFIGYTGRDKTNAEAFVRNATIAWPNAYGVSALGAAAPVIYVIGADGRIAWSDNSARLKHQIASFGADLDSAIESALAVGSRQ